MGGAPLLAHAPGDVEAAGGHGHARDATANRNPSISKNLRHYRGSDAGDGGATAVLSRPALIAGFCWICCRCAQRLADLKLSGLQ